MGGFEYTANLYFAEQLTELLEHSTTSYSLDDVLTKIVAHYNRTKQIGPARHGSSANKQSDGKDSKKKGDKSAVENPAIRDGAASTERCQLCTLFHSATDCPMFQALKKQSAAKLGELLPGKSTRKVKGDEQRQAKMSTRAKIQMTRMVLYAQG